MRGLRVRGFGPRVYGLLELIAEYTRDGSSSEQSSPHKKQLWEICIYTPNIGPSFYITGGIHIIHENHLECLH